MDLKNKIKNLAAKNASRVVKWRRHLHANPELSFEEKNTARYIAENLREMGLTVTEGVADTGVTALIHGEKPSSKVLALRADIDALPIVEENDVSYKSTNKGVMHACGHDVHTSSLLGSALILNELRSEFAGTVKLIFQPGEEKAPGGASKMIEAGVLKNPAPEKILGQHVMTQLPVGKVGFKEGLYMASADEIYITVKGKGGHAAMPDKLVDPILVSAHILTALQQIVSRNAHPTTPTVLSFGKITANGATNIIPNEVKIEGTFRTLNEKWRREAHKKMKHLATTLASSMGAECDFNILVGYPFLFNHELTTRESKNFAVEYMGEENVVDLDIWMAAEDFSYYSQEMDACFYRLGVRNEARGITSGVHTPTFNVDESSLEIGSGLMSWLAINHLNSE
jgi:amidohydrolase